MAPPNPGYQADHDDSGLPPHPLICGLAFSLDQPKKDPARLAQAKQAASHPAATEPKLTEALRTFSGPRRAQVVMFAGYLGPTEANREGRDDRTWQLLYQDMSATSWLLVPQDDIVLHQRAADERAAFGVRDVIWVRADAPVRQGEDAESEQARFLVGSFTSADELHASLTAGGTLTPESGILCAPTPNCCMRHSR